MSLDPHAHQEKAKAAISSVLWSLFLTGIKVWAGVATNSLGILSEALHSGLDFFAAAMTFYAVRVAAIPPDSNHPYGHEKVENLSALVETALLVVTCIWITWEAVNRMFFSSPEIDLTWWAFAVVAVSLVVDVNRSAMLRRVAKKHNSQALEADALHFTTDIWSSAVVLAGLVCVWLAGFTAEGSLLQRMLLRADAVAAMAVAAIILKVSWNLSKRAIHALMDGSSDAISESVRAALAQQAPNYPVLAIRSRDIGSKVHIELTIGMSPLLHVDDAHALTERVESIARTIAPDSDIIIHVEPCDPPRNARDDETANHIALRYDIRLHSFRMVETPRGKLLKIDIELPEDQILEQAYPTIQEFKQELARQLGLYKLVVRVEPACRVLSVNGSDALFPIPRQEMETLARKHLSTYPQLKHIGAIDLEDLESAHLMTVNGIVDRNMTVLECHELASGIEHGLHHILPRIPQIAVILKPGTDP